MTSFESDVGTILMNAMSRDIQFVLHQHSKSQQFSGLGPTETVETKVQIVQKLLAKTVSPAKVFHSAFFKVI